MVVISKLTTFAGGKGRRSTLRRRGWECCCGWVIARGRL